MGAQDALDRLVEAAPGRVARDVPAEQSADEHDVAPLLVQPAAERVGLQLLGGVEAAEHLRFQGAAGPQIRDHAHDPGHQERQRKKREDEPRHEAPAAPPRASALTLGYCAVVTIAHFTFCPIVDRSKAAAFVA